MTKKQAIIQALYAFAEQRPGLDPRNYISHGCDDAGRKIYQAESRSITKDLHHARALLRNVEQNSSVTAEYLKDAFKSAYKGRLALTLVNNDKPNEERYTALLDYCPGQYWPTEYRKAVCAVVAAALWDHYRDDLVETFGSYEKAAEQGKTIGTRLRENFKHLFDRSIAERWFK
jgi:hypothetical protein